MTSPKGNSELDSSAAPFPHVPYGKSVHGEEEIAAVVRVLRTSTQMGAHVREFEDRIARLFDKPHGIMVNSGSSALLLAVEVLGLPPGSEVITRAGNGGILCVRDEDHARKARLLRSWGRSSSLFVESEAIENRFDVTIDGIDYDAKFLFEAVGYNLEPSELGAAFGLVQLANLQKNIAARIANFEAQYDFFKRYEDWFVLPRQAPRSRTGWLAFPL